MKITQIKLPKSQIEIKFELTSDEFQKYINNALLRLQKHIKVDGFRPGQAPNKMVEDRIKPESLLMEAGDIAVKETYLKYIQDNKLEPIGNPEVSIVKIAQGSPFIFKAVITVLPEIDLPDYKKIVSQIKRKEISVAPEEIEDALNYVRKSRAKFSQLNRPAQEKDFVEIEYSSQDLDKSGKPIYPVKSAESGIPPKAGQFNRVKDQFILGEGGFIPGFEKNLVNMKAEEEKEFSLVFPQNSQRKDLAGKEIKFKVKMITVQKVELPEINDEFAKSLGKFSNLDSLKNSIKEGIAMEKSMQEKQKQRNEMLEKIAQKLKIETPESLINLEKERLFRNFQQKISNDFKITFKDYLASIKEDEQTLKESFLKEAEKKVKNFLILKKIGEKENISVADNEVEEEINQIMKNYSADIVKKIDIKEFKEYIKEVIYNEKVFQFLEKLSQ